MHDENESRESQIAADDVQLTLSQAAKITPGRPSTNCVWRWCRRGVIARSGERIKLEHIRVGGKLFTTARWIEDFGKRLAEADAEYFDRNNDEPAPSLRVPAIKQRFRVSHTRTRNADIERELEEAGL